MHYYNIKIKSDDSEYCLNSSDKDIIQREMDLYFAALFNVSGDFVDKIKKVGKKDIEVKRALNVIYDIQQNLQELYTTTIKTKLSGKWMDGRGKKRACEGRGNG